MRVIVTRPGPQAGPWVSALRSAGLEALSLPLIEIIPAPNPQAVRAAWQHVDHLNALMFVSSNAVEHFFALQPAQTAPWTTRTSGAPRCYATGPGTVAALMQAGVPREHIDAPAATAAQFDSEALWQVVQSQVRPGWRVLIVRGDAGAGDAGAAAESTGAGREWLAARLQETGATVAFLVAYVRRPPPLSANALALLQVASHDRSVWLFSSSEAVQNLVALAPGQSWGQARAVATHARIAEAARAAGFGLVRASRPAVADVLASIESLA